MGSSVLWNAWPTSPSFSSTALLNSGRAHFRGVGRGHAHQQRRSVFQFPGDARQLLAATADEPAAHQEIARKIAHERQFRRDHQVGALRLRSASSADNQRGVSAYIAGRGIDL